MNGKLVTLKEQAGEAPNGTSFMITTGPTPELDRTNLVVGKVRLIQLQGDCQLTCSICEALLQRLHSAE